MNNFKFRIWDKKYNQWAKTSIFKLNHSGELVWNRIENSPNGQDDFVIQQYTGLNDSNNKEIYIGDIVKSVSSDNFLGIVEFGETYGYDYDIFHAYYLNLKNEQLWFGNPINLIVIGNIFENPELIGVK